MKTFYPELLYISALASRMDSGVSFPFVLSFLAVATVSNTIQLMDVALHLRLCRLGCYKTNEASVVSSHQAKYGLGELELFFYGFSKSR